MDERKEITKEEILEALDKHIERLKFIKSNLTMLDAVPDNKFNRNCVRSVTFTLFELIDTLVNTEADIYNYFHKRG